MQGEAVFVPAKKGWVAALLCAAVLIILLFVAWLRHDLRDVQHLNPRDYVVETPLSFTYQCEVGQANGAYTFRGWACVDGERITSVNCFVVLYDTKTKEYLRLPTTMERNAVAGQTLGHENYDYGGFTAFVVQKQLSSPAHNYEICFAYRNNAHNELVHTGQMLAGGTL